MKMKDKKPVRILAQENLLNHERMIRAALGAAPLWRIAESGSEELPGRIYRFRLDVKETIDAWVDEARPPGGFVEAVLRNDLAGAFARADDGNRACMHEIVKYVYNEVPSAAWGSEEMMREWSEHVRRMDEVDAGVRS